MSRPDRVLESSPAHPEHITRESDFSPKSPFTPAQKSQGHGDVTSRLRQLLGVGKRELLTMEDIAADYHFPSAEAARKFVRRYVPYVKRGRRLLVDRRDFDAVMKRMGKA